MEFRSFGELAAHFYLVSKAVDRAIAVELDALGHQLVVDARSRFGTYQDGWPPLADRTRAERVRLGFTPDDPLYRSGGLQGAVDFEVTRDGLFVGIRPGKTLADASGRAVDAATVMAAQEFPSAGSRIPPRPVFAGVAYHMDRNAHAFGLGVAVALFAKRRSR